VSDRPLLLLASNSPRRRQLLALGAWNFRVAVSEVDECQKAGEPPGEYVLRLAAAKARAVAEAADPEHIILAADTCVADGGVILGKPGDSVQATEMLRRLRGHSHQVYTGIAGLRPEDGKLITDLCVTEVPMRAYSDAEIEAYVLTGDPLDKAGAYGIQRSGFVESMHGCFASVMGLPMCHVVRVLRQFDVVPATDVPVACQSLLKYDCQVSSSILNAA